MQKRSRKHLGSEFQSRLIALILIASGMGSIVSTCCAAWWFSRVAGSLPNDGHQLLTQLPKGLLIVCAGSLCATLPLFVYMARNATFNFIMCPRNRTRAVESTCQRFMHNFIH